MYERPQFLWLRVALHNHGDDITSVRRSYDMISMFQFMPASPILFNSGTKVPQLSSCFLMTAGDRIEDIFDILAKTANIGQGGGGLGLGLGSMPCQGCVESDNSVHLCSPPSYLLHNPRHRSNARGEKNPGLVPILKMFDATSDVIEKGKNRRPSAITAFIEPWHPDVLSFVRMKRISGNSSDHTERLFYGLWMNDLL